MKQKFIYQKPSLKFYRKENRNNPTPEEKLLWKYLRKKQLAGYRFQRQYSIETYILDFYCAKVKLGIELDGSHHSNEDIKQNDETRTLNLNSHEITIIRFWNSEINNDIYNVLDKIYKLLIKMS